MDTKQRQLVTKLYETSHLTGDELYNLLENTTEELQKVIGKMADRVRRKHYGDSVYMRGLIEFTNYCKCNCKYCGIRSGNTKAERYRLSKEDILACAKTGYELGYRTFVLQGGEDPYFTDEKIVEIVSDIKNKYPEVAVTLSIGEKSYKSYKKYFDAGADRYLLRHETVNKKLYEALHPYVSLENRIQCLYDLKDIGYQVGTGFMVGVPGQTNQDIVKDLQFIDQLKPHMIGIGPFMPQKDTPLGKEKAGSAKKTSLLLAILRLMRPDVLLPSTTSLGSIEAGGREMGLKAGANVVMPNLSPAEVRKKYALYDGKVYTGEEAAQSLNIIKETIKQAGYHVDMSRGDHKYASKQ